MKRIHVFDNHLIPKRFQNKKLWLISESKDLKNNIHLHIFTGKEVKVSTMFGLKIPNYQDLDFNITVKEKQYIIVP